MLLITVLGLLAIIAFLIWMCTFDKRTIQKECCRKSEPENYYAAVLIALALAIAVCIFTFILVRKQYL